MSPVHRLSQMGSMTTNKIDYPSMLAGYGDFGAMTRIQYTSLGSNGTIVFSNIPTTFQDLMLVVYARGTNTTNGFGTANYLGLYLNNDTSTIYSTTSLRGNGTAASSTRFTGQVYTTAGVVPNANATTSIFGAVIYHILNYTNTSTFKTVLARSACDLNGSGQTWLDVNLYRSTNAITQMNIYDPAVSGNALLAGSTAALYGVRASAS